jgi:spermidine/putrescine transport system substrate-binding protein
MKKFCVRSLIILFWIALILGSLYWPKLKIVRYDANTLNIFAWGDILDPTVISQFEKDTGIKVNLNYYSSNEEMLVKLKATKGEGYDLIIPSDYAVNILIQEKLLKELDRSKLHFWNEINPNLLGHHFDPDNRYSIPFEWEVFVFGIDKDYFSAHPLPSSWKLIFDKDLVQYKISMTNDPIEAVRFASFYLFGPIPELSPSQAIQVKNLLIEQKQWVEAYASFRGDYFLATKNCPVVVASSSYIWRTMRQFPFVSFLVPEEGTFITIENLAIPALSQKEHLTYQFINYLYSHYSVKSHFDTYGFFPSTLHSLQDIEMEPEAKSLVFASEEQFKKFYFIQEVIPQQQIHDTWVEVKSGKY